MVVEQGRFRWKFFIEKFNIRTTHNRTMTIGRGTVPKTFVGSIYLGCNTTQHRLSKCKRHRAAPFLIRGSHATTELFIAILRYRRRDTAESSRAT